MVSTFSVWIFQFGILDYLSFKTFCLSWEFSVRVNQNSLTICKFVETKISENLGEMVNNQCRERAVLESSDLKYEDIAFLDELHMP